MTAKPNYDDVIQVRCFKRMRAYAEQKGFNIGGAPGWVRAIIIEKYAQEHPGDPDMLKEFSAYPLDVAAEAPANYQAGLKRQKKTGKSS